MQYNFNFRIVTDNLDLIFKGLALGLELALISIFIGMILGLFLAFCAISKNDLSKKIVKGYVTFFRNTPLLILVYVVYFGLPSIGLTVPKNSSFILTLALYSAAYMTEVFRAGLESIPKGLIEAGQAIGLKSLDIKLSIQLPIMFKKVLPSLGNYIISLFKDTSIAAAITVEELTYVAKTLNTQSFRVFEVWGVTALLYIITCYFIAFVMRKIEYRVL